MNAILRYVINMMPYMLLCIPFYLVARIVFLKAKKRTLNWYREALMLVFVAFLVGLASQAVLPKFEFGVGGFRLIQSGVHQTNLIPFKVFAETYDEAFVRGHINYFLINFLGNVILFIPIGICIPLLWNCSLKKTLFLGFCSSLFIEISQLFLPRGTDVDDLILNTSGVFLGILVYRFLAKHCKTLLEKFK